jgi:alginate O-acetyltransferase complex protein AlgI
MMFTDPLFLFVFLPAVLLAFYLAASALGRNSAFFAFSTTSYDIFSVVLLLLILFVNFSVARTHLRLTDRPLYGGRPFSGDELRNTLYIEYKIVFTLLNHHHVYHSRQVVQAFWGLNEAPPFHVLRRSLAC